MPPPTQAEDGAAAPVRGLGPVGGARRNAKEKSRRIGIHPLSYDIRNYPLFLSDYSCLFSCLYMLQGKADSSFSMTYVMILFLSDYYCLSCLFKLQGRQSHQGNDDHSIPLSDSFFFLCL